MILIKVLTIVAVSSSLVLVFIFLLGEIADFLDVDSDFADTDEPMSHFSLKGVTTFLTGGSWVSLICHYTFEVNNAFVLLGVALISGQLFFYLMFQMMLLLHKLKQDSTLDPQSMIGLEAKVYISLGPGKVGKVTVSVNGSMMEFSAVSESQNNLPAGKKVLITGVISEQSTLGTILEVTEIET